MDLDWDCVCLPKILDSSLLLHWSYNKKSKQCTGLNAVCSDIYKINNDINILDLAGLSFNVNKQLVSRVCIVIKCLVPLHSFWKGYNAVLNQEISSASLILLPFTCSSNCLSYQCHKQTQSMYNL